MKASVTEHRVTFMVVCAFFMYFMWMDVALYYRIQSLQPVTATTTSQGKLEAESTHLFSPFAGLSVKLMMMDQINNYIFIPLADVFNEVTHFSETFYFITPNMVSLAGLLCALVASKFIMADSLTMHRVAVLLFQFRTFFDALDGKVARARIGLVQHISMKSTSGYWVDGLADSLGFAAFLTGCFVYLKHKLPTTKHYLPVSHTPESSEKNGGGVLTFGTMPYTTRRIFFVVTCFGVQLAISAFFWDRYISQYHTLLEIPVTDKADAQSEVLRSSITWIILWFWRISNAHALVQMFLFAVFINHMWEFLLWIQYIGFIELFTLAFFSELHLTSVKTYLA